MELSIVLLLLVVPSLAEGAPLPNATFRAKQTLGGLLSYYWKTDPKAKSIGFFFACGQIGAMGNPNQWKQCTCYTRDACTNCYRWWDAVALESIANDGIYTDTKDNANIPDVIFSHSPYNDNWNADASCTYIDDFTWYGIAYLRVYEWLKDPKWLNRAVGLYNWTWQYGWDNECGGFWWTNCEQNLFKDSITIVEILHLATKLAYMFPHEEKYLNDSLKIWDWFFSFDDGYGLMSDQYLVSTGANPEMCCNNTITNPFKKCINSKISGLSYNQGLLMSASAFLYKRTGNKSYLDVGLRALEAVFQNYTTKEGVLVDEARGYRTYSYQCVGWSDPGGDWYSFSGIFMNHLSYFADLLASDSNMPAQTLQKIKNLVQLSSDAAWNRSAVWPPFSAGDACNSGPLKPKVKYPKFHWWWGQNVTTQSIVPSDPRKYFHKTQLRCVTVGGNNTQLYEGMFSDETACRNNCTRNPNCSKYLFEIDQVAVQNINCWIWSYNRSNHICSSSDYDFNVGIKRPYGNASCAGRCNSKQPLKLEHGVCYCDSECTKHLDCCLDYANHCTPSEPISCKGHCEKSEPIAVRGGGYCWCVPGCNTWGTDNNSDGTCCPDYSELCLETPMPECLDARSQGSALNLFLAHLKITQIK